MAFRKFMAEQLFNGYTMATGSQVLVTTQEGIIEAVIPVDEAGGDIEILDGILTPGFINCHCHLELSHLKNIIPPHTGLVDFLCSVVTKRGFAVELIQQEIMAAEREMFDNGIVAVGDIGNTQDTLRTKSTSKIRWHNFIEVLSFTDARATENIAHYQAVLQAFEDELLLPNRSVLTPHAPYSISPKTFELLNDATARQIISIHNQENPAEDELYNTGGGDFLKLYKIFGVEKSPFPITGKSSVQSYLPQFTKAQTIILVHNTYMPPEDILFADNYAKQNGLKLVYCLCPNANLYIENRLPAIDDFLQHDCLMVLGTDSYSSNWQLSIAKEIQVIHANFPHIPLSTILQWATSNAAAALQWNNELGSFKKGMKPGLTLLSADLETSRRIL